MLCANKLVPHATADYSFWFVKVICDSYHKSLLNELAKSPFGNEVFSMLAAASCLPVIPVQRCSATVMSHLSANC